MKIASNHSPVSDETLLLYAAGELTAAERSDVDQALRADADASDRLASIRRTLDLTRDAFAGASPDGESADVTLAAARASSAVRQWQAAWSSVARPPAPRSTWARPARRNDARPSSRVRWAKPTAAAAAILLLAAGVAVMRLLPNDGRNNRAAHEPAMPPLFSAEEREFHVTAVRWLAMGGEVRDVDTAMSAGGMSDLGVPAEPMPVAAAGPLALAGDNVPVFDVPLAGDEDADGAP